MKQLTLSIASPVHKVDDFSERFLFEFFLTTAWLYYLDQNSIKLGFSSHIDGVITGGGPFKSALLAAGYDFQFPTEA